MVIITPKRGKVKAGAEKAPRKARRVRRVSANDLAGGVSFAAEPKARKRRKKKINAEESLLRIERVRRGDANNRIEGIYSDPKSNEIFAAYIRGEIEVTEMVPQLKLLYFVS